MVVNEVCESSSEMNEGLLAIKYCQEKYYYTWTTPNALVPMPAPRR